VPDTVEVRLRRARACVEAGEDPQPLLDRVLDDDPWEWRAGWLRGIAALSRAEHAAAAEQFSRVWTDQPGELAPKLALALAAEGAGEHERAAQLYERVTSVDDNYVSATLGLARCRLAMGDRAGAAAAFELVPTTSAIYIDAQLAATRARVAGDHATPQDLDAAAHTVDRLLLDSETRATVHTEILEAALTGLLTDRWPADPDVELLGASLDEPDIRRALERAYRDRGRAATNAADRIRLVDRANAVRPMSLF
jgi:serine/threonine-protein kinase PknG